jgi:hypothetical protein
MVVWSSAVLRVVRSNGHKICRSTFSNLRPSQIYPKWDFRFENKPSGKPGTGLASFSLNWNSSEGRRLQQGRPHPVPVLRRPRHRCRNPRQAPEDAGSDAGKDQLQRTLRLGFEHARGPMLWMHISPSIIFRLNCRSWSENRQYSWQKMKKFITLTPPHTAPKAKHWRH